MPTLDDLLVQPVPQITSPEKSLDDLLQMPVPETAPSTEKGQGFWRSIIESPEENIPFMGGVIKGAKMYHVIDAASRLQEDFDYAQPIRKAEMRFGAAGHRGDVYSNKERDAAIVEEYLRRANKKYTGLGQVGRIVGEMPAFMIEFLATGGLKKLGEKGAIKVAEKLMKGQAKRIVARAGVGMAKYMSGAALRSAGLPQRAAVSILKRQLPKGISYGPDGEINIKGSGETWATSVVKGLGDHYIEILSEQAGEIAAPAMGKALKRTPFLGKLLSKMEAKWLSLHKTKTAVDFVNKIGTKTGFNGAVTEIGEEFYGNQLRAVFKIDDFDAGEDAGMLERMDAAVNQDIKNLPVMAAAFMIPGVGRAALGFAVSGEEAKPIQQQGTEAVSEVKHKWTPEEIDTTFGEGINEALEQVAAGELGVDEIVEMSELREIEERKTQGLPTINQHTVGAEEFEKKVSKQADEYMKGGMPQDKALAWAEKTVTDELEEELGTKQIQEEGVDVTPEKGKVEFFERKKFENPKTTVVKEIAKLVETGLSIDQAISTLQEIRTPKTQERTHQEQIKYEVKEIIEGLKQANPNAFNKEVIGTRQSKVKEFKEAVGDQLTHYHWKHMRIGRILEWLDGKVGGPLTEYIWKPMRAAVAQSTLGRGRRMKQLDNYLDSLKINLKELYNKRIEIREGLSLRPVDMIEVFLATKDADKLRNLKKGNRFSEEDIEDILAIFMQDERLVDLGHWLLIQYSADYDDIADKYNKTTGKELPKIKGYSSIRRLARGRFARLIRAEEDYDELLKQLLGSTQVPKRGMEKGMVTRRTKVIGPLNLDALSNYVAHARAVEHYKAMALPVYNANQILNNKDFRAVVQKKTKGAGNLILTKWLQDVASERTSLENNWTSRVFGMLRRNAVTSALGLNLITALKQPLSLSIAAAESPKMIPGIMKAFAEGVRSPKALKKFVHDRSIVVKHRNMEREIREMSRRRTVRKKIAGKRALSEKALIFVRMADKATVTVVWKAAYDMKMSEVTNEQDAIAYADSVIERTQPMADIMDLPHFYRGSELDKMLTVFLNQINQNYNYWSHDILGATKRGEISKSEAGYRVLMSYILPAAFLGLIGRGFNPGDWKDWAKDMASFAVSPIFMFGRITSAILNGFNPASMIGFNWSKELFDAYRARKPKTRAVRISGAAARLLGAPWSAPKRFVKGVIALNEMETDDPRRLIWSEYALREPKDKSEKSRLRRRGRRISRRRSRRRSRSR